jgi:hypothetical protein
MIITFIIYMMEKDMDRYLMEHGAEGAKIRDRSYPESMKYVGYAIYFMLALFIGLGWSILALEELSRQTGHPDWRGYSIVCAAALAVGGIAYLIRERSRIKPLYGITEIAAGVVIAAQMLNNTAGPLPQGLAFIAGLRIVIDGINRTVGAFK